MKQKWLIRVTILFVVLVGASLITGIWARRYIDRKKLELLASLPFKIEELQTTYRWRELLSGKIERVAFKLRLSDWVLSFDGPLRLERRDQADPRLHFAPRLVIESAALGSKSRPSDLAVRLDVYLSKNFTEFQNLKLEIKPEGSSAFEWKYFGLKAERPELSFTYQNATGAAALALGSGPVDWASPSAPDEQLAHVESLAWQTQGDQKQLTSRLRAGSGEVLWNRKYYELPVGTLDSVAVLEFEKDPKDPNSEQRLSAARVELSNSIRLNAKPLYDRNGITSLLVSWLTPRMPAAHLFTLAQKIAPSDTLEFRKFALSAGTIESRGKAFVAFDQNRVKSIELRDDARLQLRGLNFRWPEQGLSIKGLSSNFARSEDGRIEGTISIDRLAFRRLRGSLQKTGIILSPVGPGRTELRIGQGRQLPFEIPGIPLRIESVQAIFDQLENGTSYSLNTGLDLGKTSAQKIARLFCIPLGSLPKASLNLNFPEIRVTPDMVEPIGTARLDLLGGTIELSEMGAFDLLGAVPEVGFNLVIKEGIRLDQLGAWAGMGEMDGLIQGYARNVTFLSWLPTRFDLKLEVAPHHRSKVVFSPEAMKNVVRLFSGNDINYLPGIADWLAFGWPSRVLGGYDVFYAGFRLRSAEGSMVLETLDPKDVLEETGKHFILYGRRFMMPLRTSHYPLVADATAMSNFIRHVLFQIEQIRSSKQNESDTTDENTDYNADHNDTSSCFPAD